MQQEARVKTKLITGQILSPGKARAQSVTVRQWEKQHVKLEQVKRRRRYPIRKLYVANLVKWFGDTSLGVITPVDVRTYRAQRVGYTGRPVSIQTINQDHPARTYLLNVARSPQFRLITDNPAAPVPKSNPQNERDRIATADEWEWLKIELAPSSPEIVLCGL